MSMTLTDLTDTTFYTFPSGFDLHDWMDHDFSARSKLISRFGRHGAKQVSDRAVEAKTVKITGAYHASNQAALKSFINDLKEALYNNGEEYRFSWESGYYIGVSHCEKFRAKRYRGGLSYKSVDIEITLVCPDPFWYATTADSLSSISITTNPQTLTFTSNGTVPAPLTIQCDPTADWHDFTLENLTDDGNKLRMRDPGLGSGDTLIINCKTGAVTRNGLNAVHFMSGAFLRVLPGSNAIRYAGPTGGAVTLSAPRRYL